MERQSKDYLCYCGLYCKLCTLITITPQKARELHENLERDGWENFGEFTYEGFKDFWNVLQSMSKLDKTSPLCRGGCGDPECKIRFCAKEKGVDVCAQCDEYPCDLVRDFDKQYHIIIKNNDRIREIGLDAWMREMDELAARGLTYRDL